MTPEICTVKHDPPNGSYGDCVRACVASILDLDSDIVPHFFHDNAPNPIPQERMSKFLAPLGLATFVAHYPASLMRDDLLTMMGQLNPDVHYMLFGRLANGGDHVVVCKGDQIVHDPAWFAIPIVEAGNNGYWSIMVIARA